MHTIDSQRVLQIMSHVEVVTKLWQHHLRTMDLELDKKYLKMSTEKTKTIDYYLTQALSGYGYFSKYLYDLRKSPISQYKYCAAEVYKEKHTLFNCPR